MALRGAGSERGDGRIHPLAPTRAAVRSALEGTRRRTLRHRDAVVSSMSDGDGAHSRMTVRSGGLLERLQERVLGLVR